MHASKQTYRDTQTDIGAHRQTNRQTYTTMSVSLRLMRCTIIVCMFLITTCTQRLQSTSLRCLVWSGRAATLPVNDVSSFVDPIRNFSSRLSSSTRSTLCFVPQRARTCHLPSSPTAPQRVGGGNSEFTQKSTRAVFRRATARARRAKKTSHGNYANQPETGVTRCMWIQ